MAKAMKRKLSGLQWNKEKMIWKSSKMHNKKVLFFKVLCLVLPNTLSPHSKNQMVFIV